MVFKEGHNRKNLVKILGSSGSKIILILLIEVIVIYMGFTTIYIGRLGFQGLVLRVFGGD